MFKLGDKVEIEIYDTSDWENRRNIWYEGIITELSGGYAVVKYQKDGYDEISEPTLLSSLKEYVPPTTKEIYDMASANLNHFLKTLRKDLRNKEVEYLGDKVTIFDVAIKHDAICFIIDFGPGLFQKTIRADQCEL